MKHNSAITGVVAGILRDRCCYASGIAEDTRRLALREWPAMPASPTATSASCLVRRRPGLAQPLRPPSEPAVLTTWRRISAKHHECMLGGSGRSGRRGGVSKVRAPVVRSPTSLLRLARSTRRPARVRDPYARRCRRSGAVQAYPERMSTSHALWQPRRHRKSSLGEFGWS
jgi:hypothetical protein